jgi:hypothetical protein
MKNFLRISALFTATLMVFIMVGCGGDDTSTDDTKAPTLVSSTPATGGTMASNGTVSLVFSEKMGSVTVNGSAATAEADGKTFKWSGALTVGDATLAVAGKDVAGNELAAVSLAIKVTAVDKDAPDIAATSSPKNGATGVDPASVTKIVIVFTEAMGSAKVDAFEPADAKIDSALSGDTLTISFLGGYKLSNEMTVKATLSGADTAGNALKTTTYTFATMKKEE